MNLTNEEFIEQSKRINTYKVLKKLIGELSYAEVGDKFQSDVLYDRGYNITGLVETGFLELVPIIFPFEADVVGKNHSSVLSFCQNCLMQSINLPLNKQCGNCGYHKTITYYDAETIQDYITSINQHEKSK